MKPLRFLIALAGWFILLSATPEEACSNAENMIRFVEQQTEEALEQGDISLTRYHAFKALKPLNAPATSCLPADGNTRART